MWGRSFPKGKRLKATILGIGSTLMADEGFGPAAALAASSLLETRHTPDSVEISVVDGGVLGMKLLPYFQSSDLVVVLDVMDVGAQPGSLFRFTPEEAELEADQPWSAHEMALPHVLQMTQLVGAAPEVVIIACQAGAIEPSTELTPEVADAVPRAAQAALDEVERFSQ
jgi:hydrogenase maturation protease